jgi:hypothetical protein
MGLRQGHLEFSDSGALDSSKPVSASTPENGLMTDTGITMRVIPTTVSVGAIGISDTTGINRQNRKNSYTLRNPQSLPLPRSISEQAVTQHRGVCLDGKPQFLS